MDRRCNFENGEYTKLVFSPLKIVVMKEFTYAFHLINGSKDYIITDVPLLVRYLGIKLANQSVFVF